MQRKGYIAAAIKNASARLMLAALICAAFLFPLSGSDGLYWRALKAEEIPVLFAGGSGIESDPYLISSPEHLDNVRYRLRRQNPDFIPDVWGEDEYGEYVLITPGNGDTVPELLPRFFALAADINLTAYLDIGAGFAQWGDSGWLPLGEQGEAFYGVFDGRGHTVSGLWMDRPDAYAGLFGFIGNSDIKDLKIILHEKGITGGHTVGGLAAVAQNIDSAALTIERCSVTGNIMTSSAPSEYLAGGVAGSANGYLFLQCMFSGTVSACLTPDSGGFIVSGAGGIAGRADDCAFKNCLVSGDVFSCGTDSGSKFLAGLAGTYRGVCAAENCLFLQQGAGRAYPFFGAPNIMEIGGPPSASVTGSYYSGADSAVRTFDTYPHGIDWLSKRLTPEQLKDKGSFKGAGNAPWDFQYVWGHDREGNILLRAFGIAYDPPPPANLLWLWITIAVLPFIVVCAAAAILYRRKKPVIVREVETVEVIKEIPVTEGQPLPMEMFTPKEKRVAELLLLGRSRRGIAESLGITEDTVRNHTSNIFSKAEVNSQKAFIAKYLYDRAFFEND